MKQRELKIICEYGSESAEDILLRSFLLFLRRQLRLEKEGRE